MDRCRDYETMIERMLADEIDAAERDRLLTHAERCHACREYVELHHRLLGSELAVELPTDEELADVRGAVLERIRSEREASGAGLGGLFRLLWLRPAWAGAAALALLVTLAGGVWIGRQGGAALGDGSGDALAGILASPDALYSNVSLRDAGDGTMTVDFDFTRHVELRRPREHPQVRELLVHSMLTEASLGGRLEAMSQAWNFRSPEVKQALIRTLLNDPDQVVRQRALETLTGYETDDDIEVAMIAVLRTERTVHLRLMALDLLAAANLAPERVEQMLGDLERREDRAVLVRAGSYFPDAVGVKQ